MAMTEVWKPIPGYKGYEVSNLGRVRSLDRYLPDGRRRKGTVLRASIDTGGYPTVTLGHRGQHRVHRIVMLAFCGPVPEGKEVCHLDGNRQNNAIPNLRYDTRLNNIKDAVRHGTAWWLNA